MTMNTPEIEELKLLIEQKYGKTLGTTTDFEEFSVHLSHDTGQNVSASTLKRLWGYVNDSHKPRMFTLDILAQYLGHANYYAFVSWLKTSTRYNSSFFNAKQLISNELDAGTEVEIGWSPNRLVRLRYVGESRYEVVLSQNSKLVPGDSFVTGCFIKEQPLYLPYIERSDGRTAPFVAGRNGGLTIINVINIEK
ncbi:hypothetical protein [Xylanibacter rarus]|uniref:hypothetical protein n=1 Tax=Xylanibacter rarus TaxID=1676614 RepID=UPI003FD6D344